MKNNKGLLKGLVIGFIVGAAMMLYSPAFGAAAKQYILTAFTGKVIVNGVEYKDAANPILNYSGKTYLPLAKIGDLTGVPYRWNSEKKQVEIGAASGEDVTVYVPTPNGIRDGRAVLAEKEADKKFQEENKLVFDTKAILKKVGKYDDGTDMYVFEAYDKNGWLIERITDNDDFAFVLAKLQGKEVLPPSISQGWIKIGHIVTIYDYTVVYEGNDMVFMTPSTRVKQEELMRFTVPEGWETLEIGETTVNGVRMQKYDGIEYFNIEDMMKVGLIK